MTALRMPKVRYVTDIVSLMNDFMLSIKKTEVYHLHVIQG